ncbi:MAG: RnfABCDGE type electron transport complex subunit B [Proteobacteria bacterium]|nr:RnfABCDGE type electron transport complex subunit B [Pseudomonadota bacterium]MDA1301210.1 RnfABCDGE type electron transport complex subunit B [Pseudomonadota bacterium]
MDIVIGPLTLMIVGLIASGLLIITARRLPARDDEAVVKILELLPQTQCAQCGYPGCRPYAEAIAAGEAINRCPPGGEDTVTALANLLGRPESPLDTSHGDGIPRLAAIRAEDCIGCGLCLAPCPVDAIIGAPQQLHVVLDEVCTGCALCVDPCPVDCIDMIELTQDIQLDHPIPRPPCIHCGNCVPACPRDLAPQQLYLQQDRPDVLETLRISDCIECSRCDKACPADIPLTATFRQARADRNRRVGRAAIDQAVAVRVSRHEQRYSRADEVLSHPPDPADLLATLRNP